MYTGSEGDTINEIYSSTNLRYLRLCQQIYMEIVLAGNYITIYFGLDYVLNGRLSSYSICTY